MTLREKFIRICENGDLTHDMAIALASEIDGIKRVTDIGLRDGTEKTALTAIRMACNDMEQRESI
jgi:hypothetical protein